MNTLPDSHIAHLAESCVNKMGDIFWDYEEHRDAPLGHSGPYQVALDAVASTLHEFAVTMESNPVYTGALRLEYRQIVAAAIGAGAEDERIIASLVQNGAWTDRGARIVLQLAKGYGTSTLRNALALAEAMDLEDGETGV